MMEADVHPDGRYTREKLFGALTEVCAQVGLDSTEARLLRFVNNGVFLLPDQGVVVRIVLAPSFAHRAVNVVKAARWLEANDVPAVRLVRGIDQPVLAGGHVATLWQAVRRTSSSLDGRHLGSLLRRIHELPPNLDFPRWRPLDDVRRRLRDAEDLDDGDREFLDQRCDEIELRLETLDFQLPRSVVHGDAHLGNLIPGPKGAVVCDLDSLCVGPPEWDLTPTAVGSLRMGHPPERHRQLVEVYGFDVTSWPGFQVLRELRELKIATSPLPILRSNPEIRAELHHRLRSMRSGDAAEWAPYR